MYDPTDWIVVEVGDDDDVIMVVADFEVEIDAPAELETVIEEDVVAGMTVAGVELRAGLVATEEVGDADADTVAGDVNEGDDVADGPRTTTRSIDLIRDATPWSQVMKLFDNEGLPIACSIPPMPSMRPATSTLVVCRRTMASW